MFFYARKNLWILTILWISCSVLFLAEPSIDILVSSYFFDPAIETFPLAKSPLIEHLNNFGRWLIFLLALATAEN
ncbi:hypothetical protein [Candidatus Paracaedibacter symbiosus]|uniref:hypothetical protein n=1 Tax=Candidatus Paracaedibacter symbiosus TaxID=244582 RepID=UPI000509635F|nr:hypothetical protein [Candidatus Paracaedibacter symbiosus]